MESAKAACNGVGDGLLDTHRVEFWCALSRPFNDRRTGVFPGRALPDRALVLGPGPSAAPSTGSSVDHWWKFRGEEARGLPDLNRIWFGPCQVRVDIKNGKSKFQRPVNKIFFSYPQSLSPCLKTLCGGLRKWASSSIGSATNKDGAFSKESRSPTSLPFLRKKTRCSPSGWKCLSSFFFVQGYIVSRLLCPGSPYP